MPAIPASDGPSRSTLSFLFGWLSSRRTQTIQAQNTPTVTTPLLEENIDSLLIQANKSKTLADTQALLNRASEDQRRVVIEMKIPGVDLISVVGGFIERTSYVNGKLVLLFREFQSEDLDPARQYMKLVTNNDPRRHNPPYSVYIGGRQIMISFNDQDCYHIRNITLA
jgi:hypothetical protein